MKHFVEKDKKNKLRNGKEVVHLTFLVVNYGISNTIVLEIPEFTTKPAIFHDE